MKYGTPAFWTALIANVSVLVGLVFVALEIRQASAIATAQVRLEYAAGWRSIDGARQDPAFAALIVQSVDAPESLTPVQRVQLDAYYIGVLDQMLSAYTASEAGVRLQSFESAAESVAGIYFSSAFARSWWEQARGGFVNDSNNEFVEIMDRVIRNTEPQH